MKSNKNRKKTLIKMPQERKKEKGERESIKSKIKLNLLMLFNESFMNAKYLSIMIFVLN